MKMKKYSVYGTVVGSKYLGDFEAKTKKAAIDMACKVNGYVSICHRCSSEVDDPQITKVAAEEVEA